MAQSPIYDNPEPVPSVSQLAALPFVAAVAGYLTSAGRPGKVTLHRVMTRDGQAYLQQICSYAGPTMDHSSAGRLFPVSEGIIGKAFRERLTTRTKHYSTEQEWLADYMSDRQAVSDTGEAHARPVSYLAMPFLNKRSGAPVCILYAQVDGLNVFVAEETMAAITALATGYCRFLDDLSTRPLPRIRNYPLLPGTPVAGADTVFPTLQETIKAPQPPCLTELASYNFAPTT